ncbi:helix-turn-helix domain-containing protein [Malaciobacter marinus]|uniref:helix-turn-helix domain-containing protein n=1 Tax=Malaciobacter marinus TaxID=505249 RepID=UPI003B00EE69
MIFERIRRVRENLGYSSQEEFALTLNMSKRTYQTYEQGTVKSIPHTFLCLLNEQYNVSLIWIMTGNGEMFENENNKPSEKKDIDITSKISEELTKLTDLQKEYYYHKIKSDALENEIRENVKGKQ